MAYFEEAVDFLMDHPMVTSVKGIGVCAISKGAEIALCMASALPSSKIGAVGLLNTICNFGVVPVHYHGELFCEGFNFQLSNFQYLMTIFQMCVYYVLGFTFPPFHDSTMVKPVGPNLLNAYGFMMQLEEPCMDKIIPFASCKPSLLFIAGSDDQISPSVSHVNVYASDWS